MAMTRRRSPRSASTPPINVSTKAGAVRAKLSSPIMNDDAPRFSNSHGSAISCAQVPRFAAKVAKKNVPKRRENNRRADSAKLPADKARAFAGGGVAGSCSAIQGETRRRL